MSYTPPTTPVLERVLRRVLFEPMSGCWLWTGAADGYGYGSIGSGGLNGVTLRTHRVVYEHLVGPIPDGLELDHLCRVPACCNPIHLDPVTHAENVRRGRGGESSAARARAQTHCKNGHVLDEKNVRFTTGRRYCGECGRLKTRAYRARKMARQDAA